MLKAFLFHSPPKRRALSDAWLVAYNEHRPDDALGRVPPLTFLQRVLPRPESRNAWPT